jgi:isochorismate hydrolase
MNPYQRSGKMVSPGQSVLLLIDLQDRLLNVMAHKDDVLANSLKLIEIAKIMGVPIVASEQNPERLGPTNPAVIEALQGIQPVGKVHFSCFGSDQLRNGLEKTGRKQVITAGVETHVCVSQTVVDGQGDYDFYVAADAVSSRTDENRRIGLDRCREAGALVGSTEMFLYELLEKAGTEEFRAALKYLK